MSSLPSSLESITRFRVYHEKLVKGDRDKEALVVLEKEWLGENGDRDARNIILRTSRGILREYHVLQILIDSEVSKNNYDEKVLQAHLKNIDRMNKEIQYLATRLDYTPNDLCKLFDGLTISPGKRERGASDESPAAKRTVFF
jgi:hypothetical protein